VTERGEDALMAFGEFKPTHGCDQGGLACRFVVGTGSGKVAPVRDNHKSLSRNTEVLRVEVDFERCQGNQSISASEE
jgi:hypothetical protein